MQLLKDDFTPQSRTEKMFRENDHFMGCQYFQIIDVFVDALRGFGIPIRNVHNEDYGDEGFWYRTPVALKDGVRRGTFRDKIQSTQRHFNDFC